MIVHGKAWGSTSPIFEKNNVEMHYLNINKGGYCSTHFHQFKFNKFIVIKGELKVIINRDYGAEKHDDITVLTHGQEITVSPGDYHSFEALTDCEVLEVYWVELNATDIIRKNHGGNKQGDRPYVDPFASYRSPVPS